MNCSYSVVIPTLNAEKTIVPLLDAIKKQEPPPRDIFVADSQSDDNTVSIAEENGMKLIKINRQEFDHGKTRDMALRQTETPYVVFLTQDAMPADEKCIANLLKPMIDDPNIAVVGGRQQAYPTASNAEKLVRAHNYPNVSQIWDSGDIERLGVRAYLISDVFAAYRKSAYEAVGGFDYPILTNEDMLITQKFLKAGYKAAYAAEAVVLHSHDFTLRQQFKRNYIVGRTLVRYENRFVNSQELGEGVKLAKSVLIKLLKKGDIGGSVRFAFDCAARLIGNRMGKMVERKDKERKYK